MVERQQNFQNIAWFKDLYTRGLIDLNPRYQRRSVWPPHYRVEFVDTVLLNYPTAAIFLFEQIDENGSPRYAVVDGKQRLTTVLEFLSNRFAVSEKSPSVQFRGMYYDNLPSEAKKDFLRYRFSVEYLPSENEAELDEMFNRLNRNIKKLTAQELRHAKFDGEFIRTAELLSEWLSQQFPIQIPRITDATRRQMKDVEIVEALLLFLEDGPKSYSSDMLDEAVSNRDETWERRAEIHDEFMSVIRYIKELMLGPNGTALLGSRLKNQADFYSLFAAIAELRREQQLPTAPDAATRLVKFIETLESPDRPKRATDYFEAARSASNDIGPRKTRIDVLRNVLLGNSLGASNGAN